ncbi:MAG TPA: DUF1499 domain-containing protein [Gemmatimonadaceae bacterium]|nr:DUF1499 domain-containing protein [Gemmatimonadaceae bacterium]
MAPALDPCPSSPNCVSTKAPPDDRQHHMPVIPFTIPSQAVVHAIMDVIADLPRTRVVSRDTHYVRAEFRTRLFRFVDDVEFAVDPAEHVVHFRSASRVRRPDFGVNRRRMEELSRTLHARLVPRG